MHEHPPVELPGAPSPAMVWNAWGTSEKRRPLPPRTQAVLQSILDISPSPHAHEATGEGVELTRSTMSLPRLHALESIVGASHVSTADHVRLLYLGGKSTLDLLARRSGAVQDAPDAVVFPADDTEIESVLRYCSEEAIAVVPFGGGTSVVGGVDPVREWFDAVLCVSLARLSGMTEVDEVSRTAVLQAGATGPQAEEMLGRRGLSLGHFPQSFEFATVGGFAATRSSGQASAGYGRFDDMVEGLTVVTPEGIVTLGHAPASAAGPDLRQVFLGSEGTLGIISSVRVRVHPVPETVAYRAWWFSDFAAGTEAFRLLAVDSGRPTVMRLSDEAETGVNSALSSHEANAAPAGGCVAITTFEGSSEDVEARVATAETLMNSCGAVALGPERARDWEHGRFDSPYLRDALLDVGALAETLETAASWSNLETVRGAVTTALVDALTEAGTPPVVMCHISHVYSTGASLYFTVVCACAQDPSSQWRAAKTAAMRAISESGATITHHHAVGRDHRRWMPQEVGTLGTAMLRGLKSAVDPAGILNPGKLIP